MLSSRDMRFSAVLNAVVPCESGDGFRSAAAPGAAEEADEAADGRDVPVDELDEDDVVR